MAYRPVRMELEKATPSGRPDAVGDEAEGGLFVDRTSEHAALCKWTIPNFSKLKQRTLWSNYATVGGFDCRLLLYRAGTASALATAAHSVTPWVPMRGLRIKVIGLGSGYG